MDTSITLLIIQKTFIVHTNNIESKWHALKLSLTPTVTGNYCFNKILRTRNISMMDILPNISFKCYQHIL
ncbi:hypothetical protein HZS_6222 [Henneguya salminicola]|nr:hypothetical protein HZS_6222 [Henneguya salminicola]